MNKPEVAPGLVPSGNALLLTLLFTLVSCTTPPTVGPNEPEACGEQNVTWETFAEGFFTSRCQACHATETLDRRGAPDDVSFNEESDVLAWQDRVRARVIDASAEESMPPGGGISDDERALLEQWLDCSK